MNTKTVVIFTIVLFVIYAINTTLQIKQQTNAINSYWNTRIEALKQ